jgi:hypothetical protein
MVMRRSGGAPSGRTYGRRPFTLKSRRVRGGRTPALAGGAREERSFRVAALAE